MIGPPRDGGGHVTTRMPPNDRLRAVARSTTRYAAMSAARSGMSSRDGGDALVAQQLEPGDHRRCLGPHVRAVDRRAPRPCARGSGRGSRAGTAAARSSRRPTAPARAPARTAPPTGAARGARAPRRGPRRARARRPTTGRRGRPASTRRRSRSRPRPSAPAAVRGRRRSSRAGSAPPRRRGGGGSRRRRARSAALRRRTPRARRRRPRRRRCLRGQAPTLRPRRCGGFRLRLLRACGERRGVAPFRIPRATSATSRGYAGSRRCSRLRSNCIRPGG